MLYAYMEGIYSSRKMETAVKRDVNFMWLLSGEAAPDHTTINRFRKERLGEIMEGLFYQFVKTLHELGEVEFEEGFIDGTKLEANANRYTFVWKKAIEKNEGKMHLKASAVAEEINKLYLTGFTITEANAGAEIDAMLFYLRDRKKAEGTEFVYGSGKKKSNLQKLTEALEGYKQRQDGYEESKAIFEGRNSYSKTDNDATFMRMKDDHMRNGQLKPGYNVQLAVEGEYVAGVGIFPNTNDVPTLVPMMENMRGYLGIYYKNLCTDSGYESEENYAYLEGNNIKYYIKPQLYEQWKKKSYKKNISKRENMEYDETKDEYICHNGKRLQVKSVTKRKSKTGYESEITVYECEDCRGCPHKEKCTKAKGNRQLEVSKKFIEYRDKSLENITTEHGTLLRVNRSIQSEGAFGILKQDRGFTRFLTRGSENVKTETLLLCFAFNVNKLHAKIQSDRCGKPLHELKPIAA
jgi:transposase